VPFPMTRTCRGTARRQKRSRRSTPGLPPCAPLPGQRAGGLRLTAALAEDSRMPERPAHLSTSISSFLLTDITNHAAWKLSQDAASLGGLALTLSGILAFG